MGIFWNDRFTCRRGLLKQTIYLLMREYPNTPCAVLSCPCIVHRLGMPQAPEIFEHLPPPGSIRR